MGAARIGITLGDPSGIGPEIVSAAVSSVDRSIAERLVVYGDRGALGDLSVEVVEVTSLPAHQRRPGAPSEAGARAQLAYLEAAVAAAQQREIAAIVTAPISKTQIKRAGFPFDGHTEFLAERFGAPRVAMMFAGVRLRVVLATIHMALRDVPGALSIARVRDAIELAALSLAEDFGLQSATVGVVGLNPHAGEQGLFGDEERRILEPAIASAQLPSGCTVVGPLVPDVAFRAASEGHYHALVAMYHDQALIPVKLIEFERAVNVTLGLPIVRTSPDHGVAYDIAGTGAARATSFRAALELAVKLAERRRGTC